MVKSDFPNCNEIDCSTDCRRYLRSSLKYLLEHLAFSSTRLILRCIVAKLSEVSDEVFNDIGPFLWLCRETSENCLKIYPVLVLMGKSVLTA